VSSIHTVDNSTNNLNTEHFTVTFFDRCHRVDASDFTLHTTGQRGRLDFCRLPAAARPDGHRHSVTATARCRLDLNNTGDPSRTVHATR